MLFLSLAAIAAAWFWQDSLAARERANAAAIEACERMALQFLDGTVAFARIGWARSATGRLTLRRTYVFDYTATSIDRLQGFVVLTGHRVETVGYARDETAHRQAIANASPHSDSPPPPARPSNILQLDQWRSQHRPTPTPQRENREDRGDQRH